MHPIQRANSSNTNRGLLRTLLPLQLPESSTIAIGSFHQIPIETTGTSNTVAELSEAECDIDTLKKMKLGVRSSLWSRPSTGSNKINPTNGNPSSDYSIAV